MRLVFPNSADVMEDEAVDTGSVRPAFICGEQNVKQLLKQHPSLVILARDTQEARLQSLLQDEELDLQNNSVSIALSKGLEFNSVVILDLFRTTERPNQWQRYLLDPELPPLDERDFEMEVRLGRRRGLPSRREEPIGIWSDSIATGLSSRSVKGIMVRNIGHGESHATYRPLFSG